MAIRTLLNTMPLGEEWVYTLMVLLYFFIDEQEIGRQYQIITEEV